MVILNLNNHKITNLANPVTESDSVNKGFLDNAISNIVPLCRKL